MLGFQSHIWAHRMGLGRDYLNTNMATNRWYESTIPLSWIVKGSTMMINHQFFRPNTVFFRQAPFYAHTLMATDELMIRHSPVDLHWFTHILVLQPVRSPSFTLKLMLASHFLMVDQPGSNPSCGLCLAPQHGPVLSLPARRRTGTRCPPKPCVADAMLRSRKWIKRRDEWCGAENGWNMISTLDLHQLRGQGIRAQEDESGMTGYSGTSYDPIKDSEFNDILTQATDNGTTSRHSYFLMFPLSTSDLEEFQQYYTTTPSDALKVTHLTNHAG